MSNPNLREAEDLDQLLSAAETILVNDLHLIFWPEKWTGNDLRDILQRAYSIGYDAAHQDHVDGNLG
jgi:hypothetical protein